MDILSLFSCFSTLLDAKTFRQLFIISQAVLAMTGRVTMLGISRWTDKGGSYRTIQRFFQASLPWTKLFVLFFESHFFSSDRDYILVGDETVVSKAGKETFGIDRLFSGAKAKTIKGLSFFVFSLVDCSQRKSYPVSVNQMVRSEEEKQQAKKRKLKRLKKKKRCKTCRKKRETKKRGRTKGSKNRDKSEFKPSPELMRINVILEALLKLIRRFIKPKYVALDGYFGHNQAVLMALENGLHLISKLRRDSALFYKYEGEQNSKGPRKIYGEQVNYEELPKKYLKKSEEKKGVITNYYQMNLLHREFGCELNVLIIQKIQVKSKKIGHAILFSSDLDLTWEKILDYYSLRFQIEFNFREAKQHFGLEDFVVTSKTGVENAANLAFMMVNLSEKLQKESGGKCLGTNDLKSHYRGVKYARMIIKRLLKKAEPIIINKVIEEISQLGSIHRSKNFTSSA